MSPISTLSLVWNLRRAVAGKFRLFAALLVASCAGTVVAQAGQSGPPPLGLNVDLNEQSYVDLMSFARIDRLDVPLDQDEDGWPATDFQFVVDNRFTFAWIDGAPNVDPLRYSTDISGTHRLSFSGQALLVAESGALVTNQVYDVASNTTTADVEILNEEGGVVVALSFILTRRAPGDLPGTGLTNLSLIRPGYSLGGGQVFTDWWLGSLTNYPWNALRFMEILGTDEYAGFGSLEAYPYRLQWDGDRSLPGVGPLYYRNHRGVHGMPWEYVILAGNATNSDVWITIPVNASDDYLTGLATLLQGGNEFTGYVGLNKNVNIYVEYSNELWHFGYPQGAWNYQAAIDEVASGDSNLNYDGSTDREIWRERRIAKRTLEIAQIFAKAFAGDASRIRPVINDANIFTPENMLQYVNDMYGPPSQYLYGVAITTYYGSADKTSVDAIIAGEQAASDRNVPGYILNRGIATYWGLHLLAYEGGQEEEGDPRAPAPLDPYLVNQFAAARDPRMAEVEFHDLMDNWYPSGGELYMQFSHVRRLSTYGMWGVTEDLTDLSGGKWNGMVQVMESPLPEISVGAELPAKIGADVVFWRAPPARFEQWLVRSPAGGSYQLVINLDTRWADNRIDVLVNNTLIQSLNIPRDSQSSGSTDLPPVPLSLSPGLSVVRLKLLSGDTNLNALTFSEGE